MKTMKEPILNILVAGLLLFALSGCLVDEKAADKGPDGKGGVYVLGFRAQGAENKSVDYVLSTASLTEGEISAEGRGLEQTGWRYMGYYGNLFYSIGYYSDHNFIAYGVNGAGQIEEKGRFAFQTTLDVVGPVDEKTLLAVEIPRKGFVDRVFHIIDLDGVSIKQKVPSSIHASQADSMTSQPTSLRYRDGKVFVSFYQLHARGDFSTPNTDTAFVAVYNYPSMTLEKVIKDTRIGPLGIYGNENGLIPTESGDLYGYSCASKLFGFTTQSKPSGILRIKKGESEFDPGYHFDVEAATGGSKLVWFAPVGGDLAVGRLIESDTGKVWGGYSIANPVCKLAVLNLVNKTVHVIKDVPKHGAQYATPILVDNGKAYMCIADGSEVHIYEIDPTNASAKKGAKVLGKELQAIARISK